MDGSIATSTEPQSQLHLTGSLQECSSEPRLALSGCNRMAAFVPGKMRKLNSRLFAQISELYINFKNTSL